MGRGGQAPWVLEAFAAIDRAKSRVEWEHAEKRRQKQVLENFKRG